MCHLCDHLNRVSIDLNTLSSFFLLNFSLLRFISISLELKNTEIALRLATYAIMLGLWFSQADLDRELVGMNTLMEWCPTFYSG